VIKKYKKLSATEYEYTADITIHGITKSNTFKATITNNRAGAKLKIDRSKFA